MNTLEMSVIKVWHLQACHERPCLGTSFPHSAQNCRSPAPPRPFLTHLPQGFPLIQSPSCFWLRSFSKMPKHSVCQLMGDVHISHGKWEFSLEGVCWRNTFSKWGVFPFPTFSEEAVHVSFGSFHSPSKVQFVFKLEILVVLAEVACCYL